MEQKSILGILAVIFLASILFFPQESNRIGGVLILGMIFTVLWFFKK